MIANDNAQSGPSGRNGSGTGSSGADEAGERQSRFPYSAYFSEVNIMPALLMMPDEIPWLHQVPREPGAYDTVLYIGC